MRRLFLVPLLLFSGTTLAQSARFAALGFSAPVPSQWEALTPASNFRLAQYRVPGAGGDGEAVVFYFGKGQGGSVAANIRRWSSQFTASDGSSVQPKTQVMTANGLPVTTVELNGTYSRGVGIGPQGAAKPNQTLLVAVIETAEGNMTLQLHGPRDTVASNRKGFEAMVRGFRKQS